MGERKEVGTTGEFDKNHRHKQQEKEQLSDTVKKLQEGTERHKVIIIRRLIYTT